MPYIDTHGWKRRTEGRLIVCEGPLDDAGQPIVAFIPSEDTLPDYSLRIEDLVHLISAIEERPANEMMKFADAELVPPGEATKDLL